MNKTYGAGLSHAQIRNADDDVFDIEAIIEVSADPSQDAVDVAGDDTVKTQFVFSQTEDLTVRANAITMDALEALTGNTMVEIGTSPVTGNEIPLGTDSEQAPPFVELSADIRAKTSTGDSATIRRTWHKVQFSSVKVINSNGNELSVELTGKAFKTALEIDGTTALTPARIQTLLVTTV